METLNFYVGVIGNLISVLMFLSPAGTFWRIVEQKSTGEYESFPYICTLLSSSLWTYYGLTKPDSYLVATINGFGILVEIVYVSLFLVYASPSKRESTALLVGILNVGFFGAAILASGLAFEGEARIDAVGFVCAGLNILMYGSPLAVVKTVVTTRSVEYMPFLLSFFLLLNGGIWTFYAILASDYFLMVPNVAGLLLGAAQLVLYAVYKNAKPSSSYEAVAANPDRLEDGSRQEPLISSSDRSNEIDQLIT